MERVKCAMLRNGKRKVGKIKVRYIEQDSCALSFGVCLVIHEEVMEREGDCKYIRNVDVLCMVKLFEGYQDTCKQ